MQRRCSARATIVQRVQGYPGHHGQRPICRALSPRCSLLQSPLPALTACKAALASATSLPSIDNGMKGYARADQTSWKIALAVLDALMYWLEKLHSAQAELAKRNADPLGEKVEAVVRGMEAVSTHGLLDLLGLPKTTSNARRVSTTMRSLGFIPIKSRRLMPGGYRDTVTRGWARSVREFRRRENLGEGGKVTVSQPANVDPSSSQPTERGARDVVTFATGARVIVEKERAAP